MERQINQPFRKTLTKKKKWIITIISLAVFLVFLAIKVLSINEQFARPDTDNAAGLWKVTPLWSKIDEVTADDADFIKSSGNPATDLYQARLSDVSDPLSSTGHIMRVRYKSNDSGSAHDNSLTFRLKQGSTLIHEEASISVSLGTFTTTAITLTAGEADSITDYTNLNFEFSANQDLNEPGQKSEAVVVSWAEFEVPASVPVSKGLLRIRQDGLLMIRNDGLLMFR